MHHRHLFSVLLSGLLAACSQSTVLDEETVTTLGPSGGNAKSADGLFILEFPANALSAPAQVSIRTVRSLVPAGVEGPVYDLTDNSFSFSGGVRMSISEPTSGEAGFEIVELSGSQITALAGAVDDEITRRIAAPFLHFGRFGLRRHPSHVLDAGLADARTGTTTTDGGTANHGALRVDQRPLDFGHVEVGGNRALQTFIFNESGQAVSILAFHFQTSGAGQSAFSDDTQASFPVRLEPGDSLVARVLFTPPSEGVWTATFQIETDSTDLPRIEVPLVGVGGIELLRCSVLTRTGSCGLTIRGDNIFNFYNTEIHDFQLAVDRPCDPDIALNAGWEYTARVLGTATTAVGSTPTRVSLAPAPVTLVEITHVVTRTTSEGRLSLIGTGPGTCFLDLSAR
ncbi:MAG: hypothetical protein U1E65_17235 [Myxococcota bacterium]